MLDDFLEEQKTAYQILTNSIKNNKCSHAYLIESNGYSNSFNLALSFAKYILCKEGRTNNSVCSKCGQCKNIDKNEFLELKIINPDGQWIKKSQLEDLQESFSKKSIVGSKKVYIINGADKLNISSSNSILKFLEEPYPNIIAILLVENRYQLLSTIVSRCQIISLIKDKVKENLSTLGKVAKYLKNNDDKLDCFNTEENKEKLKNIIEFIKYYESNHLDTILYINKLWNQYFKEKEDIYNAYCIMILFYKDVFNLLIGKKIAVFDDYKSDVKQIASMNSIDSIISKINLIIDLRDNIKYNANTNLLMDKLIINLEGSVGK